MNFNRINTSILLFLLFLTQEADIELTGNLPVVSRTCFHTTNQLQTKRNLCKAPLLNCKRKEGGIDALFISLSCDDGNSAADH
jgi:hypothetical protein